ncbi:MAG: MarR family winged helix-turn-helix transcriptional regulator [Chitinophagaceae bacterium]
MSTLEKLIVQKNFANEDQKGIISLIFIGNWVTAQHQQFFKRFQITMQQFNILRILRGQFPEAATINLLKERMLDKMSDVSRLVERLRKAGWVERKLNTLDRRCVNVKISKKGLTLLKKIDDHFNELPPLLSGLSQKEKQTLNLLLDKILSAYP